MEIQQLRYFAAAAELGNFTRAAEKCFVAQPSLSQQIIKLEKELGQKLFDRAGRTVRLTDAGRSFYDDAVEILAAVDRARRKAAEADDAGTGRVAVGAIPTVAPYLLPGIIQRFVRRFPRADVVVYENFTEQTVKSCLDGTLDLAVLALPVDDVRLVVEPLFSEPLLAAMAANHPLAARRRITLDDLAAEPFILLAETHCLGRQIVSFCREQSCRPTVSCHSAQLLTVQELIALGHGMSLIPRMAVEADKSNQRKYLPLAGDQPQRTLAMIWRKHRYQGPLVRQFIEEVRRDARKRC